MSKIRFTYRVFLRDHRAARYYLQDVLSKIHRAYPEIVRSGSEYRLTVQEAGKLYLPLSATDAERAKERGLMLITINAAPHAMVREWPIELILPHGNPEEQLAHVLEETGQVFTNIEFVTEVFTDVSPQ